MKSVLDTASSRIGSERGGIPPIAGYTAGGRHSLMLQRSRLRVFALAVLVLLGAPVAMHVVIHDLHGHHHDGHELAYAAGGHGDHEHPIASSPAPQVRSVTRVTLSVAGPTLAAAASAARVPRSARNVVAFGALRTDTDVGLQLLLATFLI